MDSAFEEQQGPISIPQLTLFIILIRTSPFFVILIPKDNVMSTSSTSSPSLIFPFPQLILSILLALFIPFTHPVICNCTQSKYTTCHKHHFFDPQILSKPSSPPHLWSPTSHHQIEILPVPSPESLHSSIRTSFPLISVHFWRNLFNI